LHRVVWSQRARSDLAGIRDYVSEFAPMAGQRLALRLVAAAESLAEHPLRGRSTGGGRRALVAIPPYLIRYRITDDTVEIITIRHGARRPAR
jgi:addiction module RelE/StbE family toxin